MSRSEEFSECRLQGRTVESVSPKGLEKVPIGTAIAVLLWGRVRQAPTRRASSYQVVFTGSLDFESGVDVYGFWALSDCDGAFD